MPATKTMAIKTIIAPIPMDPTSFFLNILQIFLIVYHPPHCKSYTISLYDAGVVNDIIPGDPISGITCP